MSRIDEPGWVQIGLMCKSGRRSLWWRVTEDPGTTTEELPAVMELCAGREGDDAYIRLERPPRVSEVQFRQYWDLWDVLSTAEFAGEEVRDDWVHLVSPGESLLSLSLCGEVSQHPLVTDLEQATCPACRMRGAP